MSIKGRHSIDAEMNAEPFEYSYFLETRIVIVIHFLEVGREDTSILCCVVR